MNEVIHFKTPHKNRALHEPVMTMCQGLSSLKSPCVCHLFVYQTEYGVLYPHGINRHICADGSHSIIHSSAVSLNSSRTFPIAF